MQVLPTYRKLPICPCKLSPSLTYLPTYLLPLSLSKFMSALKTYQKPTSLPIQNYLSNSLNYLQDLPTYHPLSLSLSNSNTYLPTESYLPSYLPTYQLWRWSVCGLLKIFWSRSLPLPQDTLSQNLSLSAPKGLLCYSLDSVSCVCVCSVSLLWIYYL
jgi:hypothetical protein